MKITKLVLCLGLVLAAPHFAFAQARVRESKQLLNQVEAKRTALLDQMDNLPYRGDQQAAIRSYFDSLEEMNTKLSDDGRLVKRFNEVFAALDLSESCPKLWLDREVYSRLIKNCTKNRFFLCSEKVRQYESFRDSLKKVLTKENLARFESTKACTLKETQ